MNIRPTSLRTLLAAAATLPLSACVLDSPYFGQSFNSTTASIPIQAWTNDKSRQVKIECSKASHAGLYPWGGPENWLPVANVMPSSSPSYDPNAGVTYSVGTKQVLPAGCWHADTAYNPPIYMTALRATQLNSNGATVTFRVFNAAGLECKGLEVGKSRSWIGWLAPGCALTYANSTTPLPWVRILSYTLGVSAMSAPAGASSSLTIGSAPAVDKAEAAASAEPDAATMAKAFDSEDSDKSWADAAQHRLLVAFAEARPEGTELKSALCRQTMCQVIVQHQDEEALAHFVAALAPAGLYSGDGERGRRYDLPARKGLAAVYYLAREDHRLPVAAGR